MTRARTVRAAVFAVIAGGGLVLLDSLAPLQWPTVAVYFGLAIVLIGLAGAVLPPGWTALGRRALGIPVAMAGAALLAAGLYWPVPALGTPTPQSRLRTPEAVEIRLSLLWGELQREPLPRAD